MPREADAAVRNFFRLDDDHPFTGRHMLALILAFFAVVVGINVVMAIAATGTFPGLVVANSYVASQNYNHLLADAQAQAEAGWRLKVSAAGALLDVSIMARDGAPQRDLVVTAVAGRPSTSRDDRAISFVRAATGYLATEPLPAGQWEVEVAASREGNLVFRERRRIVVRSETP
jgi:nitrogen fixation protein FixH